MLTLAVVLSASSVPSAASQLLYTYQLKDVFLNGSSDYDLSGSFSINLQARSGSASVFLVDVSSPLSSPIVDTLSVVDPLFFHFDDVELQSADGNYLQFYFANGFGEPVLPLRMVLLYLDGEAFEFRDIYLFGEADLTAVTAIPEPSTWALMLLGFAGIGFAGWRQIGRAHV